MTDMPDPALLAAHFRGETDTVQDAQLHAWRERSAENEAVFQEYLAIWTDAGDHVAVPPFDVAHGWQQLSAKLGWLPSDNDALEVRPLPRKSRAPLLGLGLAAAVLVAALLVWFWLRPGGGGAMTIIATSPGEIRQIVLVDGSEVWLDGGSILSHANDFGEKQRLLKLEGHAYFEVRSAEMPFEVRTQSAKVRVVGTQFDVWAGNGKTRVSVREGRVALHSLTQSRQVELGPDQMAACWVDGRLTALMPLENRDEFTWMTGTRIFTEKPLADVLVDLNRIFGKTLTLSDPALGSRTLSATFRDETFEQILADICLALDLDYIEEEGTYLLTPKGE